MTRRGGPYPRLRTPAAKKAAQGQAVAELIAQGASFAQAGRELGMSKSTAWRRYWWVLDWTLPALHGITGRHELPPNRGSPACPRGRPCIPAIDHPEVGTAEERQALVAEHWAEHR